MLKSIALAAALALSLSACGGSDKPAAQSEAPAAQVTKAKPTFDMTPGQFHAGYAEQAKNVFDKKFASQKIDIQPGEVNDVFNLDLNGYGTAVCAVDKKSGKLLSITLFTDPKLDSGLPSLATSMFLMNLISQDVPADKRNDAYTKALKEVANSGSEKFSNFLLGNVKYSVGSVNGTFMFNAEPKT
ncbi:MAG: hypothetical protein KBE25_03735 [Laribacter sp.]|nr:hypothetical protein [Laribacter sp.]MBP9526921.1 hypothetical protein [Laribacter sp.]MBP9608444.1 hypothetical protein [Laribacter sp.]